jgi:hypothetical protein
LRAGNGLPGKAVGHRKKRKVSDKPPVSGSFQPRQQFCTQSESLAENDGRKSEVAVRANTDPASLKQTFFIIHHWGWQAAMRSANVRVAVDTAGVDDRSRSATTVLT